VLLLLADDDDNVNKLFDVDVGLANIVVVVIMSSDDLLLAAGELNRSNDDVLSLNSFCGLISSS
jgi:hypothetical protein